MFVIPKKKTGHNTTKKELHRSLQVGNRMRNCSCIILQISITCLFSVPVKCMDWILFEAWPLPDGGPHAEAASPDY